MLVAIATQHIATACSQTRDTCLTHWWALSRPMRFSANVSAVVNALSIDSAKAICCLREYGDLVRSSVGNFAVNVMLDSCS